MIHEFYKPPKIPSKKSKKLSHIDVNWLKIYSTVIMNCKHGSMLSIHLPV